MLDAVPLRTGGPCPSPSYLYTGFQSGKYELVLFYKSANASGYCSVPGSAGQGAHLARSAGLGSLLRSSASRDSSGPRRVVTTRLPRLHTMVSLSDSSARYRPPGCAIPSQRSLYLRRTCVHSAAGSPQPCILLNVLFKKPMTDKTCVSLWHSVCALVRSITNRPEVLRKATWKAPDVARIQSNSSNSRSRLFEPTLSLWSLCLLSVTA